MIQREAEELIDRIRQLWPSKFQWNPETVDLWAERFARDDWTFEQCVAVVRDERTRDDAKSAPMSEIYRRCTEAHKPPRRAVGPVGNQHDPISTAEWAVIHADREAAAAWWFENKHDAAEIVEQARLAFPMWGSSFLKFLDPDFKPTPIACMRLKCAWQEFHDRGERPKPEHTPGIMAGMKSP